MTKAERFRLELALRREEKEIEILTQALAPHLRRRDEIKRLLSPVAAPVVEVEDAVLSEEPLTGFEIDTLCDADD